LLSGHAGACSRLESATLLLVIPAFAGMTVWGFTAFENIPDSNARSRVTTNQGLSA
jgi:hypothetical protein